MLLQSEFVQAEIDAAAGDVDQSLKRLEKMQLTARNLHAPLPAHYWFVSADAVARQGRSADAEALFRKAIVAEPRERQAYANLALLRNLRGDRSGSRAILREMTTVLRDESTRRFAADSLEHWGDAEGARQFSQKK
jgi:Flp pilus assembly protein TadD